MSFHWEEVTSFKLMWVSSLLDLLTYWKREKNVDTKFLFYSFFFFRQVKRIGKTQQRNQREEGRRKKQDPKIEAQFKLCLLLSSFCSAIGPFFCSQLFENSREQPNIWM